MMEKLYQFLWKREVDDRPLIWPYMEINGNVPKVLENIWPFL